MILPLLYVVAPASLEAATATYAVEVRGVEDNDITKTIKATSQLFVLKKRPPNNIVSLKLRASSDVALITKVLNSYGYYEPAVTTRVVVTHGETNYSVIVEIVEGPLYTLESFDVDTGAKKGLEYSPESLDLEIGDAALAEDIVSAKNTALTMIQRSGYPFAVIDDEDIVANTTKKTISVTLTIKSGKLARYGVTTISGLDTVEEDFVRDSIAWKEGDLFSPDDIATSRRNLEELGLFNFVTTTYKEENLSGGVLPMSVIVAEMPHRRIGFGVGYSTYYEATAAFQWKHRNLHGRGEALAFSADVNNKQQKGSLSYRIPHFLKNNQDLLSVLTASQESTDGYDARTITMKSSIERRINERTTVSFGGGIDYVNTTKSDDDSPYLLANLPYSIKWHNYKDFMDPSSGAFVGVRTTPYVNTLDTRESFLKNKITGTVYQPLTDKIIVAVTASVGSIMGSPRRNIPMPYRFYGGSAHALRGYKYHTVSPYGEKNTPIGGKSILVGSVEARYRATKQFAVAAFYDVGNVYEYFIPQLDKKILRSWGLGLRYHTPIGPFRFDLAFPLDKRADIDHAYQFYVTLGHSF